MRGQAAHLPGRCQPSYREPRKGTGPQPVHPAQGRRRREETGADEALDDTLDLVADPSVGEPGGDLDIEAAIAALPPGARRVLVLAGVYGYSHEETASMLGIAVGTCKAQLHRARQLLDARLTPAEQPS